MELSDFIRNYEQIKNNQVYCNKMFKIGSLLLSGQITTGEAIIITDLDIDKINEALAVAKHYRLRPDDFTTDCEKLNWNWDLVVDYVVTKTKPTEVSGDFLENAIRKLCLKYETTKDVEILQQLNRIEVLINRYKPPIKIDSLDEYLRYYDCLGCGIVAPPTGHQLYRHPVNPSVQFPLCENCFELNIVPGWNKIAEVYLNYILLNERAQLYGE